MNIRPQVVRDLGFMIPDLFHLVLPIWLLRRTRADNYLVRPFYRDKHVRRDVVMMLGAVSILFMMCSLI